MDNIEEKNVIEVLNTKRSKTFFEEFEQDLTKEEQKIVVDQSLFLCEQLYAHIYLKQTIYGINPIQKLKLLDKKLKNLSTREFHNEMLNIFLEFHDLHTRYILPDTYASKLASLGFTLEEYYEHNTLQYIVTNTNFNHQFFKPGVRITHWNGTPIERAVYLNGEKQYGSNQAARRANGLRYMTQRLFRWQLPPDEEWIDIKYISDDKKDHEIRINWKGEIIPFDRIEKFRKKIFNYGIDDVSITYQQLNKYLFSKTLDNKNQSIKQFATTINLELQNSSIGDNLQFGRLKTKHGIFGYIRIWNFQFDDAYKVVEEFSNILHKLPQNGLIIDIRNNPGGYIVAGEILLQTLTSRTINPSKFHFLNSLFTLDICSNNLQDSFSQWKDSISESIETGAVYSQGFPIEGKENEYNLIGQQYYGPIVLIVDALSYSTADIFASGFKDHNIGPIIGTTNNMGAGGANNWRYWLILLFHPAFRIDPIFQSDLDNKVISEKLRYTFQEQGICISEKAIITDRINTDYDGIKWEIIEHNKKYNIEKVDWITDKLIVNYDSQNTKVKPLPKGATFTIAVRRTTRVNEKTGLPLEDLGIIPEHLYQLSKRDVVGHNEDLLTYAGEILSKLDLYVFEIDLTYEHNFILINIDSQNLDRIDIFIDNRPHISKNISDGSSQIKVNHEKNIKNIEIRGLKNNLLITVKKINLAQ